MASIASTYARAFADVVLSARLDANRAIGGLRRIAGLLAESTELRRVWENPAVPAEQKRRRVQFLSRITEQLEKELYVRLGFAEAHITSARELGDAEKRSLEAQIEKVTGKKIRARFGLDASLLGGAIVRVGSTIYDGSVKGQLEKIKEAISS